MHSVVTTRIILNIREAASRRLEDFSFDLHLSDAGSRASRARMSFAENPAMLRSDDDHESDIPQPGEGLGVVGVARTGVTSVPNSVPVSLDK